MFDKLKQSMVRLFNQCGLYTKNQYLGQVEEIARAREYALYLEKSVEGMTAPTKPIIILADNTRVETVSLKRGQSIIVSPYAKYVHISNIRVQQERNK